MKANCCEILLKDFENSEYSKSFGKKLTFIGTNGKDAYNITCPFYSAGREIIAARVEATDEEISDIKFFEKIGDDTYKLVDGAKALPCQDPAVAFVHGKLVVSGVYPYVNEDNYIVGWDTRFYAGDDIFNLEYIAKGPMNMKDIRIVELPDRKVGIFTRPHGMSYCKARIGYVEVETLSDINEEIIANAPLLDGQFIPEEWGGANQAIILENGLIGVVGHICFMTNSDIRHYHSMVFTYNNKTGECSPVEIIATRRSFPEGPCKIHIIADVVFTGGLIRNNDGTATLYTGISDCESAYIVIPDPLAKYEKNEEMSYDFKRFGKECVNI